MKNKIIDILLPLFMSFFSVYIILEGKGYRGNDKYFPIIIGVLILLVSIWMIIEDLRGIGVPADFSKVNWVGITVAVLAMTAYVFLFPRIGYVLSTFLLGVCVIKGLGYKSWKGALLWPAGLVSVVFIIFKIILKVPLPTLLF